MTLEIADVMKIAHLARLGLSEDEAAALGGELTRILDLVAQMDAAETDDVSPMAHPLDMVQRLRPDEVLEADLRERFQSVAPLTEDGLYLVPRVIE